MSKLTRNEQMVIMGLLFVLLIGGIIFGLRKHSQKEISLTNFSSEIEQVNKSENKVVDSDKEKTLITVHIAGAVKKPGVYKIASGSRVYEVINAAGGASHLANLDAINLAEVIKEDGRKILVPSKSVNPQTNSSLPINESSELININIAGEEKLCELPGIGPKLAQRIIEHRNNYGGFKKIEEIKNVPGIGEGKFSKIRNLICVY